MKVLITVLLIGILGNALALPETSKCDEWEKEGDIVCDDTDYKAYRACVREQRHKIEKRQALCPYSNLPKIVAPTYYEVPANEMNPINYPNAPAPQPIYVQPIQLQPNVVTMAPIIPALPPTYVGPIQVPSLSQNELVQTPVIQAPKSAPAESDVIRTVIVDGPEPQRIVQEAQRPSNITTVIKLTNLINNTNIVNVPTNLNSTNVNNIHVYTNTTSEGEFGLGQTEKGSCCYNVRPRSCRTVSSGVRRCHHRRRKECGSQCTARIIHTRNQRRCGSHGCHQRMSYVPQPSPACMYTSQWPFVACGGGYQEKNCAGCYNHDSYQSGEQSDCGGCYDDGFQYGPMYRRGPVLRPFHGHAPPCHLSGTCDEENCDDEGCYSETPYMPPQAYPFPPPMMAPGFGYPPPLYYPQYPQFPQYPQYYPYPPQYEDNFGDSDVEDGSEDGPEIETDWGVVIQKCHVVSDDGTVTIRNCTANEPQMPSFSGRPNGVQQTNLDSSPRVKKHTAHEKHHKSHKPEFIVENDSDNDY